MVTLDLGAVDMGAVDLGAVGFGVAAFGLGGFVTTGALALAVFDVVLREDGLTRGPFDLVAGFWVVLILVAEALEAATFVGVLIVALVLPTMFGLILLDAPAVFDFAAGLDLATDLGLATTVVLGDEPALTGTRDLAAAAVVLAALVFAVVGRVLVVFVFAAAAVFPIARTGAEAFRAAAAVDFAAVLAVGFASVVRLFTGLRAAWTAAFPGRLAETFVAGAFALDFAVATLPDLAFETELVFGTGLAFATLDVLAFDDVALDVVAFDFDSMGRHTP